MQRLYLDKITGFRIKETSKPVIIRDDRGLLFYSTEHLVPRAVQFNLPTGEYFIDKGSITALEKPIEYKTIKLPPVERRFPDPFNFEILFGKNPNKCQISWRLKNIFFDESFKEKTIPEFMFVLMHEFAHQYYKTEKLVDCLAYNYMLKKGYNPSQIGEAQIDTLSSRQAQRKVFLVNKILETNEQ